MREQIGNSREGSPAVAWLLAIVFLALVAAPTLLSRDDSTRVPGIVDIGTPRIPANLRGGAWPFGAPDQLTIDLADGLSRDADNPRAAETGVDRGDAAGERAVVPAIEVLPAI